MLVWLLSKIKNLNVNWDGCMQKKIRNAKGKVIKFRRKETINLDLLYRR